MYTTQLSTPIIFISLSLNHHLYDDDTHSFSYFTLLTLTPSSFTSRMLCKLYPPEYLPTFSLLTLQTLNFSSSDSNNNWLRLTPAHLTQYIMLVILAYFWWTS